MYRVAVLGLRFFDWSTPVWQAQQVLRQTDRQRRPGSATDQGLDAVLHSDSSGAGSVGVTVLVPPTRLIGVWSWSCPVGLSRSINVFVTGAVARQELGIDLARATQRLDQTGILISEPPDLGKIYLETVLTLRGLCLAACRTPRRYPDLGHMALLRNAKAAIDLIRRLRAPQVRMAPEPWPYRPEPATLTGSTARREWSCHRRIRVIQRNDFEAPRGRQRQLVGSLISSRRRFTIAIPSSMPGVPSDCSPQETATLIEPLAPNADHPSPRPRVEPKMSSISDDSGVESSAFGSVAVACSASDG